jgi:hypothetical protein
MMRRRIRVATILVAVVAIASVSFALAAVAASAGKARSTTTVSIASSGQLGVSPFGPGATVSITYSCFPNGGGGGYPGGFASVSLADIQGHQGFASFPPTCNDAKQTTRLFVPGSFVAGDAAASAFVCGFDCFGTSREIRLR